MNNIHNIARAVITSQDHILLCKTLDLAKQFYYLPGGHITHRETAVAALLREIEEEIGVKGQVERFLGCVENIFNPEQQSICHNHEYNFIFAMHVPHINKDITLQSLEQHIGLEWIPLNTVNSIDIKPRGIQQLIPQWIANKNKIELYSLS